MDGHAGSVLLLTQGPVSLSPYSPRAYTSLLHYPDALEMPNTPREGSCNRAPGCLAPEQLCLRGHFVPIQVVKLQLPPPTEMGAGARCGRFSLPFSPFGSRGFPAHLSSTSDLALCLQHLHSDWPLRGRVTKDAMNLGTGSLGGPEPYPRGVFCGGETMSCPGGAFEG